MAFEFSKGMVAVATSYSNGNYNYEKLDSYIEPGSLTIIPDSIQEQNSYRNANGLLKRPTILPYTISKIEANIKAWKDDSVMDKVMKILKKGTKVPGGSSIENKVRIRFYNPKTVEYSHAWAYYPDITYAVYGTYKKYPMYTSTRIAFVTYGEAMQ